MLTQEMVKELFDYDASTGDLVRRVSRSNAVKVGDVVGCLNQTGYLATSIDGKLYKNHRLVFLYHNGYLPKTLDHINRIKTDNRIENLREATRPENNRNASKRKDNTSGFKGVVWDKPANKWRSYINVHGKRHRLGYFADVVDAAQAYNLAAEQYFGEFAYFNGLPNDQSWEIF
jgi:hypothetical protein